MAWVTWTSKKSIFHKKSLTSAVRQRAALLVLGQSALGCVFLPLAGKAERSGWLCDQAFETADNGNSAAMALAFKGEAQRLLGRFDDASATLQQALNLAPANAWVWVELGNVNYDQGNPAGALAHYSAALAVEDNIDAWANRAEYRATPLRTKCWRLTGPCTHR